MRRSDTRHPAPVQVSGRRLHFSKNHSLWCKPHWGCSYLVKHGFTKPPWKFLPNLINSSSTFLRLRTAMEGSIRSSNKCIITRWLYRRLWRGGFPGMSQVTVLAIHVSGRGWRMSVLHQKLRIPHGKAPRHVNRSHVQRRMSVTKI